MPFRGDLHFNLDIKKKKNQTEIFYYQLPQYQNNTKNKQTNHLALQETCGNICCMQTKL